MFRNMATYYVHCLYVHGKKVAGLAVHCSSWNRGELAMPCLNTSLSFQVVFCLYAGARSREVMFGLCFGGIRLEAIADRLEASWRRTRWVKSVLPRTETAARPLNSA